MSVEVLVIIIIGALLLLFIVALLMGLPVPGFSSVSAERSQLSRLVETQRQTTVDGQRPDARAAALQKAAREGKVDNVKSSHLTLEKRLRFAQWKLPPLHFRILEISISLVVTFLVSLKFNIVLTLVALASGPIFMRWLLNKFLYKRFKAFDEDYPGFLMNLVSLLKTGMNVMGAMEAAAKTLDSESLLRTEVELMLERLKYGVSEDKSIGSFAEDVYHEEIELFVQALLLSRRMGGTLSDTLDRLAKQVRKRQHFRLSAHAAIGMQRGSVWFILAIMVGLEGYLYFVYPEAISAAVADEIGWQIWQFGLLVILGGLFWISQVTKIRV